MAAATTSGQDQYTEPSHSGGGITNADWAVWVLQDLGVPVTNNNVTFMLQWMASENHPNTWTGTAGANNPLNNGYGSGGGDGTGSYPDLATAAQDVAANLATGANGYAPVVKDLQNSADPTQTAADIIASKWADGHYSNGSAWNTSASITSPLVNAATSAANGATGPVATGTNDALGSVIQQAAHAGADTAGAAAKTADTAGAIASGEVSVLTGLATGFGIGWKAVLTIIGGILLIAVALVVMFHHQVAEGAQGAAMAAAA